MKNLLSACMAVSFFLLMGCQENERLQYMRPGAAYFSTLTVTDSLSYSFVSGLKTEDVVKIPIRIIGEVSEKDRFITIAVSPESTAQEGIHYRDLTRKVVLGAGRLETAVELQVLKQGLEKRDVKLVLQLVPNEQIGLGYADRLKATLVLTQQLVMPIYWEETLSWYYGDYSKAKHQLCIQVQGEDFPHSFDRTKINDYMSYGRIIYKKLLDTPLWDEETQQWITADWNPL
ncbi:MAG: DUF4843 domain-containing protein [Bacteroides sp.]|nr:DUF4843 domain-containing protein [Bacteroides sp.]